MFKHFRAHRHGHDLGGRDLDWHTFGPHHHRRGRRRRAFEQGDLRFVILRLIAEEPRHGYDIIKAIEDAFGGTYSPSPGVIYPTLTLLEDQGFASVSPGEGSKKLYTITSAGEAFLADNKATLDAIVTRMEEASRRFRAGPAPEIVRAVENFRTALRLRLERAPLSSNEIAAIAEAIDAAAAKIERC